MPEYPSLSSREIVKILKNCGFRFSRQKGSHQHYTGFVKGKKRRVTVMVERKDFHPDTMRRIIRQSGLTREEFYKHLRKGSRGFTLIEIMVAVAILALIASTIFTIFQGGLLAYRKGTNRALVYSEARAALDMMSREIEKAIVDDRKGAMCWGLDGGGANSDTFYFIATLNPNSNNSGNYKGDLCEMGYWLDGEELKRNRETGSIDFDFTTHNKTDPLIGNVSNLQFTYIDQYGEWSSWCDLDGNPVSVLPQAVKITLTMEYEKERGKVRYEDFTTVVHIPGSGQ